MLLTSVIQIACISNGQYNATAALPDIGMRTGGEFEMRMPAEVQTRRGGKVDANVHLIAVFDCACVRNTIFRMSFPILMTNCHPSRTHLPGCERWKARDTAWLHDYPPQDTEDSPVLRHVGAFSSIVDSFFLPTITHAYMVDLAIQPVNFDRLLTLERLVNDWTNKAPSIRAGMKLGGCHI